MSETKRSFTCIVCPNGCEIEAVMENGAVTAVSGNKCPKGRDYVTQELIDPQRTIATSVPVLGGELPLCSVRTEKAIPKGKIFDVMAELSHCTLQAPVHVGQVVAEDILGLGVNIIATREVAAVPGDCKR